MCVSVCLCVSVCVCVYRLSEDSPLTTLDALKTRIRDLEKQLSKGDRFKCLICMVRRKLCHFQYSLTLLKMYFDLNNPAVNYQRVMVTNTCKAPMNFL